MIYHSISYTVWFFLPAIMANMAPVLATRFNFTPFLNKPLDGGYIWRGHRLLGSHKTIRGLIWGIIIGAVTALGQYALHGWLTSPITAITVGALLGLGALTGDAVKSFLKRRWAIRPGFPWPPFDQIDFVIGAYLFTGWLHLITPLDVVLACIVMGLGSSAVSAIAVQWHLKTEE